MDKKNTLFLTVIAVATLLVAVVGATFAFFTAQNNGKAETPVNVKTETTDSLLFGSFDPLYIIANQQNFADVNGENGEEQHVGSQKAVSTGKIEFKRGANSETEYCYTAKLKVTSNNFVYAPGGTDFGTDSDGRNATSTFKRKSAPELLLKVTKVTKKSGEDGDGTTVSFTKPLGATGANGCSADSDANENCVYYEHLTIQRKVCTQDNSSYNKGDSVTSIDEVNGTDIKYKGDCADETPEGYDVTMLNNTSDGGNGYLKNGGEISFPTEDGGNDLNHKLNASNEKDTITDTWTAELVFVNYNWDQEYNASKADGTTKKFEAKWSFETVECGPAA